MKEDTKNLLHSIRNSVRPEVPHIQIESVNKSNEFHSVVYNEKSGILVRDVIDVDNVTDYEVKNFIQRFDLLLPVIAHWDFDMDEFKRICDKVTHHNNAVDTYKDFGEFTKTEKIPQPSLAQAIINSKFHLFFKNTKVMTIHPNDLAKLMGDGEVTVTDTTYRRAANHNLKYDIDESLSIQELTAEINRLEKRRKHLVNRMKYEHPEEYEKQKAQHLLPDNLE